MQACEEKVGQICLPLSLAMEDVHRHREVEHPIRASMHDHHKAENRKQAYVCHQPKIGVHSENVKMDRHQAYQSHHWDI